MAHLSRNHLAGAAGLGYVIAAGVESMDLLRAPLLGSSAAQIRAAYDDRALAGVTALAGVASLALYCVFVVVILSRLRPGRESWARAALVGGIAAPVLALAAIGVSAVLIVDGGSGLSDDAVRTLFAVQFSMRLLAGPLMALFVLGSALAGLRVLPRALALAGVAIAVPLCLTPLAVAGEHAAQVGALTAFGLDALWVWLVSLWLLVGEGSSRALAVRRGAFLMLVVAAGLVGIALLGMPGATASFFAWGLAPEPLAAFAGGVYVGSAALYAAGMTVDWRGARPLVSAAAVLSVSVFAISLVHLDVFELDRLQAWAWLALFAGFAVTMLALLAIGGRAGPGIAAAPWTRLLLAAAAVVIAAAGITLWADPAAGPHELSPLGGRFVGSWVVMLGVLAGWGAVGTDIETRIGGLALVALPAGALAGAVRAQPDMSGGSAIYLAALVLLVAAGLAVLRSLRQPTIARRAARDLAPTMRGEPARRPAAPVGEASPAT